MCSCTRPYPGAGPGVSVWGPQPIKSCTRGFRGSVLCASSSFISDQSGHRGEESHFSGGRAIPAGCSRACQNAQLSKTKLLETAALWPGFAFCGTRIPSVGVSTQDYFPVPLGRGTGPDCCLDLCTAYRAPSMFQSFTVPFKTQQLMPDCGHAES